MHFNVLLFAVLLSVLSHQTKACEVNCVSSDSWAVGIAVGSGKLTNPLHDAKDRQISVLPSFYYYGEQFYIENTTLGYVFEESNDWVVKLEGKFNTDGLYFNETALDSLIIAGMLGPGNFEEPEDFVSVSEVDRKLSYLGGLATDYYVTDNFLVSAGAYYDVTNVHNGFSLSAGVHYRANIHNFYYAASLNIEHASEKLNQYYYGLTPEDGTSYDKFNVDANTNYSLTLSTSYRLTKHFSVFAQYDYQKLGSNMTVSPLVEEEYSQFFFIGVSGQIGSD